jgi:hypothetical protein
MNFFKKIFEFLIKNRHLFYKWFGILLLFAGLTKMEIFQFLNYMSLHHSFIYAFLGSCILFSDTKNPLFLSLGIILALVGLIGI